MEMGTDGAGKAFFSIDRHPMRAVSAFSRFATLTAVRRHAAPAGSTLETI
jgi:hypothetical protein